MTNKHTITTIRGLLLEGDARLRQLQRAWLANTNDNDAFLAFVHAWARTGEAAKKWGLDVNSLFEADFSRVVAYIRQHYAGKAIAMRGRQTQHGAVQEIDIAASIPVTPNTPRRIIYIQYPTEDYLRDLIKRYPDEDAHHQRDTLILMRGRVSPHIGGYSTGMAGRGDALTLAVQGVHDIVFKGRVSRYL